MNDMKHVDLFSGIGGFALAAQANGIDTVCFVEKDERCREFLSKAWQGVTIHDDIKTFNGQQYAGAYLLTAGVPCQPASRAGKQRGKEDDRWLWPEAIRALAEIRPSWAIFENPPGIGDVGLAGILSDVESQGYAVRVFSIPACAVSAPHRRERFWIVCRKLADTSQPRREGADAEPGAHGLRAEHHQGDMADAQRNRSEDGAQCGVHGDVEQSSVGESNMADTERGRRGELCQPSRRRNEGQIEGACFWSNYVWLPCADGKVRRAPDDSVGLVDGLHRSLLGALGNSIVPQVAAEIINAIVMADNEQGDK